MEDVIEISFNVYNPYQQIFISKLNLNQKLKGFLTILSFLLLHISWLLIQSHVSNQFL